MTNKISVRHCERSEAIKTRLPRWLCLLAMTIFISFPASARMAAPKSVNLGVAEVSSALNDWKDATEGGDAEAIAALYDKNAIMISTFVQLPITDHKALVDYYKKVVVNPDVRVEIEEEHPRKFGDMAVNTGRYTLSYTQEGEEVSVPARFSFMYQLQGKKWIIIDHHSSAIPMPQKIKQ
jgi:hypothetical protein